MLPSIAHLSSAGISDLLGYKTWVDYDTEPKMVKNGKNAEDVSYLARSLHLFR